jgi:hypothetical protein
MYPTSSAGGGFYPPDEVITRETTRNRDAVLLLAEYADCPYRAIGKQAQYCGGTGGSTVYQDTFETATGWTANPGGTDTATAGGWERGDPADTTSSGAKQLGTTVSGSNDLVTGPLAGTDAGTYDVDGGVTSIRSAAITLPATGTLTLNLSWYLAHASNASSGDYFRVSVVHSGGTTALLSQAGAASNRNGAWSTGTANLTPYAGQSVRLLIEAGSPSPDRRPPPAGALTGPPAGVPAVPGPSLTWPGSPRPERRRRAALPCYRPSRSEAGVNPALSRNCDAPRYPRGDEPGRLRRSRYALSRKGVSRAGPETAPVGDAPDLGRQEDHEKKTD